MAIDTDWPEVLTTKQAAAFLGVTFDTLYRWRTEKIGPPYLELGPRTIQYPLEKLKAWRDSKLRQA